MFKSDMPHFGSKPASITRSGHEDKWLEPKAPASFNPYPHCANKLTIISPRQFDETMDWTQQIYSEKWEEPIQVIGNETYTYLYFMAHHYDELEILNVFLPSDPAKHNERLLWLVNHLTPGSIDYLDLADTFIQEYREENEEPSSHHGMNDFFQAHFVGSLPEPFHYLPGNCFAVSRSRIHRYPQAFYFKLWSAFTRPDIKPEEIRNLTLCLEKSWRYMFNTQYYPPKL